MNVLHKDFIQIFVSMQNEITTGIDTKTQENNECFTKIFYSNIFFNAKCGYYHNE